MTDPVLPVYDAGGLASVLPSTLAALRAGAPGAGSAAPTPPGLLPMTPCRRAVVVLVDGLGLELLRRRGGHAPFLRSLLPDARALTSGFPSTTATSMGTFGTGLPPGAHGLLGYEVLDPASGRLLNELSWEDGPQPRAWQPLPTVFEQAEQDGVTVTRVGPGFFDGSGLTEAALRGGRFRAAQSLSARVDAALAAVRAATRTLVYLYWGDVDKVGHVHGCESWQWGEELEATDAELARLARSLPADTALVITADHGMVDCLPQDRLDVAHEPDLSVGVALVGGEPRAPQLYAVPGAAGDVLAAWRERLGERAWVCSRDEAVAQGWFGPVDPSRAARIGDVVVAMRERHTVVDSRHHRPELIALRGVHGSLTLDEVAVPLLVVPARDSA